VIQLPISNIDARQDRLGPSLLRAQYLHFAAVHLRPRIPCPRNTEGASHLAFLTAPHRLGIKRGRISRTTVTYNFQYPNRSSSSSFLSLFDSFHRALHNSRRHMFWLDEQMWRDRNLEALVDEAVNHAREESRSEVDRVLKRRIEALEGCFLSFERSFSRRDYAWSANHYL
jgi:hypothetical protein